MTKDKSIDNELIDNLLKNYKKPEDLIGENGLLKQLTKQLLERAMVAEMTEHVGYDKHDTAGHNSGNWRNGKSAKTIKGTFGELALETPRDRNGTFEPQIIEKHQTRFTGFDKNILSLYSRGLSTREIQQHLEEIYGVEVTAGLISSVTDEVLDEIKSWQNRQLERGLPDHVSGRDPIQSKSRLPQNSFLHKLRILRPSKEKKNLPARASNILLSNGWTVAFFSETGDGIGELTQGGGREGICVQRC